MQHFRECGACRSSTSNTNLDATTHSAALPSAPVVKSQAGAIKHVNVAAISRPQSIAVVDVQPVAILGDGRGASVGIATRENQEGPLVHNQIASADDPWHRHVVSTQVGDGAVVGVAATQHKTTIGVQYNVPTACKAKDTAINDDVVGHCRGRRRTQ